MQTKDFFVFHPLMFSSRLYGYLDQNKAAIFDVYEIPCLVEP